MIDLPPPNVIDNPALGLALSLGLGMDTNPGTNPPTSDISVPLEPPLALLESLHADNSAFWAQTILHFELIRTKC